MEIYKQTAKVTAAGTPDPVALEKINRQAKTPLTAEQVYSFSLRLVDDQPDRDFERFDTMSLPALARMLIGKTGIADHNWSAGQQLARIYDASVVTEGKTHYIRADAYLLRTKANEELIAEIEGGIRREVSIGCSMGKVSCSICGSEYGVCRHRKGEEYEGQICYAVLSEPLDAYEFSFVAVPAQPRAGVIKAFGLGEELKSLVQRAGTAEQRRDLEKLLEKAAAADRYLERLRKEVVRLGLVLDLGLGKADLEEMAGGLNEEALVRVQKSWESRAAEKYPTGIQLTGTQMTSDEGDFLI